MLPENDCGRQTVDRNTRLRLAVRHSLPMSRPHPYYDRWEPEPPEEPEPGRRWLLLALGVVVGACLVVVCVAGGYFLLQPILAQPTLPAPPAIPTVPGSAETATAAAATGGATDGDGEGTAPPDATGAPAATVTLPSEAGDVVATFISNPPVTDGALDDWPATPTVRSAHRVYAFSGWDGSNDLDAVWQLAWDEGRLYIVVQVTDDIHVQMQEGALVYQGDSVELQVDMNPGAGATRVNPATSQVILSPGDFAGGPPSAARFRGTDDGELPYAPGHSIEVAARQTADGYVLEAAIPWADLNLTPAAGTRLGLALNANDNDTPGVARQEVMMSSEPGRTLTNPSTWGTIILESGPE